MLCWMISTLNTVKRGKSQLEVQTTFHVTLKRIPVHGTMTTEPVSCGKRVKVDMISQLGMVSSLLSINI